MILLFIIWMANLHGTQCTVCKISWSFSCLASSKNEIIWIKILTCTRRRIPTRHVTFDWRDTKRNWFVRSVVEMCPGGMVYTRTHPDRCQQDIRLNLEWFDDQTKFFFLGSKIKLTAVLSVLIMSYNFSIHASVLLFIFQCHLNASQSPAVCDQIQFSALKGTD